jgi:hypothetical protein
MKFAYNFFNRIKLSDEIRKVQKSNLVETILFELITSIEIQSIVFEYLKLILL